MLRGDDSLGHVERATPSPMAARYGVPEELASSISFGESQSAVLGLAEWIARRPCSESRFPDAYSSKMVNFYPDTRAYDLVRGGVTSRSTHVTKNDEEPITFTPVRNEGDSSVGAHAQGGANQLRGRVRQGCGPLRARSQISTPGWLMPTALQRGGRSSRLCRWRPTRSSRLSPAPLAGHPVRTPQAPHHVGSPR
jgi:hypothetical protein